MSADTPGPENPELLAAIIANPDEDMPRLMYADWLQENGDDTRSYDEREASRGKQTTGSGPVQRVVRRQHPTPWSGVVLPAREPSRHWGGPRQPFRRSTRTAR